MVEKGKPFKKPEEWLYISKDAQNLIDKMLTLEPSKRISISDALKHPWFEKFQRESTIDNDKLRSYYTNIITFKVILFLFRLNKNSSFSKQYFLI